MFFSPNKSHDCRNFYYKIEKIINNHQKTCIPVHKAILKETLYFLVPDGFFVYYIPIRHGSLTKSGPCMFCVSLRLNLFNTYIYIHKSITTEHSLDQSHINTPFTHFKQPLTPYIKIQKKIQY